MKIRVHYDQRKFAIVLPTRMLFSKTLLKLGLNIGKRYSDGVPDIPPAAVDALCKEIRRIKKTKGQWELVHIQSASGEEIQIWL